MRRLIGAVLAATLVAAAAAPAFASGDWPWPLGSEASLGFGAAWTDASGRACTHRGIDIAAAPGAETRACAGGSVSFCGPVPSAAGGRVLALTVKTPDGLSVTYMPLETASVSAGEAVETGQVIGSLAAAGDGSSPSSHLHLSVKRGELAIDPMTLLGAGAAAPAAASVGAGEPPERASRVEPSPSPARAPAPRVSAVPENATRFAPVTEPGTALEPAGAPASIRVPVLETDGRAIHELPAGFHVSVPRVSGLPAVPAGSVASAGVRLLLAAAAALALWSRIRRGAVPAPARAIDRRA